MAHLSSDNEALLALSVGNVLCIVNTTSTSVIMKYVNEVSKENQSVDVNFIQHSFSPNKKYFGAVTGDKKLLVWNMMENRIEVSQELLKRPTCLCFCNKENTVIVGDKAGDVYRYQLGEATAVQQLILGHLSMVLDVAVTDDDSFIISADRDEKIRISFYPNAYSIHSYCLGHTNLISSIALISDDLLISASADKTIRTWTFKEGMEESCIDISEQIEQSKFVISQMVCHENDVALICEGSEKVIFFCLENNLPSYNCSFHLRHQPYHICFLAGKLFVIVKDAMKPVVVLEKHDNVYVEKYNFIADILKDNSFNAAILLEPKYFTDLVKPQAKKRTNVEITPEATINYEFSPKKMCEEIVEA